MRAATGNGQGAARHGQGAADMDKDKDKERRDRNKKRRDRNKKREYDETIHKELEEKWRQPYLSGSLRELEKIGERFEETNKVTLYLLKDEFEPFIPDLTDVFYRDFAPGGDKQVLILSDEEKYERAINATTNVEVFINEEYRDELKPSYIPFEKSIGTRDFRRLTAFLREMSRIILYGVRNERDFISRYFFQKMKWNRRDVERIYFNTHSRKIYFQLNPHEQID
jgi:hypothetical protein